MAPNETVLIRDEGIEFRSYPYPPSAVYPFGVIPFPRIREVDTRGTPPEVRTDSEVLSVPASLGQALAEAAARHHIPDAQRQDVWGLILLPFLDTVLSERDHAHALHQLAVNGIEAARVERLRAFVSPAMRAYNFDSGLWDWVHLGLFDLLDALRGHLSGPDHRLPDDQFATFYREAMELALRARVLPPY